MKTLESESSPREDGMRIRLEYEDAQPPTNNELSQHPEQQQDNSTRTTPTTRPTTKPTLPVPHPTTSYWHTTHPNPLSNHRTTPLLPPSTTICIIGSGITSAFAARTLLSFSSFSSGTHPISILILEARTLCSGATGRNGGHCQPLCYDQPPTIAHFELANISFLSDLITSESIQCDWSPFPAGGCHAYYSVELFNEMKGKIAAMRSVNPELADLLTVVENPEELKRLKIPRAVGAILQEKAAALHPYKLVMHLWRGMIQGEDRSNGARDVNVNIQTNTPVTRLSRRPTAETDTGGGGAKWLVHTDRGNVLAEHVLLATNAYTAHLVDEFEGLIVPVQGQMSALQPTANALASPLKHDYGFRGVMEQDEEEDDYLVQRPVGTTGGEFMFGGGRMVSRGAGVGVSDDGFVDGRAREYLRRMLPRVLDVDGIGKEKMEKLPERYAMIEEESASRNLTPLAEWTGIMGYSRDGHPWVGGVPGSEGLWVCAGYTGHGMPNTSLCGRHVAGLIDAAIRGEDWREVERKAVEERAIPECFVVSAERMEAARRLPEVGGRVAE